jgi:low temperature requirement protein LtrA
MLTQDTEANLPIQQKFRRRAKRRQSPSSTTFGEALLFALLLVIVAFLAVVMNDAVRVTFYFFRDNLPL